MKNLWWASEIIYKMGLSDNMGREVKRVALDFKWPLNKIWDGLVNPYYKYAHDCKICDGSGSSPRAKELRDMWYGYVEFHPESNGSEPFTANNPKIIALATRNAFFIEYGYGKDIKNIWKYYEENKNKLIPSIRTIEQEAKRLCDQCYNNHWRHHLSQEDVDALVKGNRLFDFTHTWSKGKGWQPKIPVYHPTAKEVNEWSIAGGGHDSINQWICVKARCKKEKVRSTCTHCKGNGTIWESKEYKIKSEKWKPKEPPSGPAFQVWETVSEGSPVSPAFEKPEDLANWMILFDTSVTKNVNYEQWLKFIINEQSAPSMIMTSGKIMSGVEAINT